MTFAIFVNEKGGQQDRFEFDKHEVTIGRVQGNDIVLPKGNVSKKHSRIVLKDGKFIIVDLKSTNGTYVNGRKITSPLVVKGSDKIFIGDFILAIEDGAAAVEGVTTSEEPEAPAARRPPTLPPPPPRRTAPPVVEAPRVRTPAPQIEEHQDEEDRLEVTPGPQEIAARRAPERESVSAPVPQRESVSAPVSERESVKAPVPQRESVKAPMPQREPVSAPVAQRESVKAPVPQRESVKAATPSADYDSPPTEQGPVAGKNIRMQEPPRPKPVIAQSAANSALTVDEVRRTAQVRLMRELAQRLWAQLEREGQVATETAAIQTMHVDDDRWARAERHAASILDQLRAEGLVPAEINTTNLLRDVVSEAVGTGPLEELLEDETVEEVLVPRPDRIFVDREGKMALSDRFFSSAEAVERVALRLLRQSGRVIHEEERTAHSIERRVDHGFLMTLARGALAMNGATLTLRRALRSRLRLPDLVQDGMLSQAMADFLTTAMRQKRNILLSGPSQSGRTTLLAALLQAGGSHERIVSIEEAEELRGDHSLWTVFSTHGGARAAVKHGLRLRPERFVVGDLRGAEAFDFVSAAVGGQEGLIGVVQADSANQALYRVEAMAKLANDAPSHDVLWQKMGDALQLVVQTTRAGNQVRVAQVSEIAKDGTLEPIFTFSPDGRFTSSGHLPAWADGAQS